MSQAKDFLEGLSKFRIENGVDQWVHAGVHVSQPGGQVECSVTCNKRNY